MSQSFRPARAKARDRSGYLSEDTIAALVTAIGGPVAIARVSGPATIRILFDLCGRAEAEPRKLFRARLKNGDGSAFDDALAVFFKGPASYTGEDCVEFQIHGGSFVVSRLMQRLGELGARQALPGEFSFRAVRNGKMSVAQAEAIADLISATNERAAELAIEKLEGAQSRCVGALAEEIRQLAVLAEVGIDFADQDVEEVSLPTLKKRLRAMVERLAILAGSFDRGNRVQEGVRAAFLGLPNAGKSSFFNALLGEDRSIVSDVPGTTRDVVHERLTLSGKSGSVTLRLEDTAGLRASEDAVEKLGIDRALRAAGGAEVILWVVDPHSSDEDWRSLEDAWIRLGRPAAKTIGILTKVDLAKTGWRTQFEGRRHGFQISTWVETSAVTGQGIAEAAEKIADFCEKWVEREPGEVLLTRAEHLEAVQDARGHLERAECATEQDLFAADLKQALRALEPVIGQTLSEDILSRIFAGFCIGK